jgi:hypothetical protein
MNIITQHRRPDGIDVTVQDQDAFGIEKECLKKDLLVRNSPRRASCNLQQKPSTTGGAEDTSFS